MKKFLQLSITTMLLASPTILHANDFCNDYGISEILLKIERQQGDIEDEVLFKQNLISEIQRQNELYEYKDVYQAKTLYLNRQDQKYKLAFEIIIQSFKDEDKNKKFNSNVYKEILDKMTSESEDLSFDFYINYKKKDIIDQKKKFIASSLLFKSTFLDGLIYSCFLGEQRYKINLSPSVSIKDSLSEYETRFAFSETEIIKQREAALKAAHKYSSFVDNYKIHKKLESIIHYLKSLQKRFKDFANLIGVMPAKFVNFGFTK